MTLWNVQVYLQGELVSIDVVEEAEVQPMTQHLETRGYEVRSEPAWKPAHHIALTDDLSPAGEIGLRPTSEEVWT